MLALAIRFDGLIRQGVVKDQADLARLGGVSRARVSQIMNLLFLAPSIQEQILFLPRIERGKEPIQEHELRRIAGVSDWRKQMRLWNEHTKFNFSSLNGDDCRAES
jgi:predicted XRE-type DNA-binding protein